ncbi:MAG: alpha/beta hydrolase [Pseudomonadales bacterium]|nr:alpha/beta hydrolase [Pseudomonadales bacterium]
MARWDKSTPASIPDWFWECVETEAVSNSVEVEECDVCYRCWGDPGKPAILLIHGMYAHSHWWDFIAPLFIEDYYLVAMDLTGMGDSDYRYEYSGATYVKEVMAVADAAGLSNEAIIVAHSFGGMVAVKTVNAHPDRFSGLVLIDTGLRHPDDPVSEHAALNAQANIYPSKEAALMRFRLQPPQPCANEFLLTYIAKQSLRAEEGGWTWKFDEDLPGSVTGIELSPDEFTDLGRNDSFKLAMIYGLESKLFNTKAVEYMCELTRLGDPSLDIPVTGIPDAQHHVFLDQPLAFVEALKQVLIKFSE